MNLPSPVTAYIGLGSNLQNPAAQLECALQALRKQPGILMVKASSFYRSKAVGPGDQPDYVNAAVQLETTLSPIGLLDALQSIENTQGRVRGEIRWVARTLDLDLLLYGDQTIQHSRLQVPHPRMTERAFVLKPLLELAPTLRLPDGQALKPHLDACAGDDVSLLPNGSTDTWP
ncbi:7,8-dihydro-6-hydroxymethylpterin-pyrophosphokinase [gamma proteobacterium HdN1]|nr:7,8-dihydro-6-hydroxymethylpterin-pyrophosphokinase [gamma proteobacterium HdN1]